jgi:hypothetical protein
MLIQLTCTGCCVLRRDDVVGALHACAAHLLLLLLTWQSG